MSFETATPPYNSSDPAASFVSSSCLDFLLIELVPLAHRVAKEQDSRASSAREASLTGPGTRRESAAASISSGIVSASQGASTRRLDEDDESGAVRYRLEAQGYRVGQGLVERFSRDRARFNDTLDVIKFLCKDLWLLAFGKNIDNLKTNHRGVYVLTDNVFRPFARMSTDAGGQALTRAQPFLWFPSGIVRGALAALGVAATVQADVHALPGAVFQIKTISHKA